MIELKWLTDEYDSLVPLLLDSFEISLPKEEVITSLKKSTNRSLIAVLDGVVVGHIMISTVINYVYNNNMFFLTYVCVKEDVRNKGIGTLLLKKVEEIAVEENITSIEFTSGNQRFAAHALYKKNGYTIRDTSYFIKFLEDN